MARFWQWRARAEDSGGDPSARLILSGMIDSDTSWYDDAVTPKQFAAELAAHDGEDITVEINSPGGDVFAGWEIYNALRSRKGATRVLVTGECASIASVVAMAADPGMLHMCRVSLMMIHNPYTIAMGDAAAMRKEAEVLDVIREMMCDAYMDRFAGTREDLTALLDAETYLTPQRAVELGLADGIDGAANAEEAQAEAARAAAQLERYAAADPAELRRRWGLPPAKAKTASAGGFGAHTHPMYTLPRDYLAEADAILGRYGIR